MHKSLADSGLSTAGEALVVDRILHARLDYRMSIWPVVRGAALPLHLHSWIVLEPIGDSGSRQRLATERLERGARALRRRHVREEVISEGLWRTLGLKWRDRVPPEFAWLGEQPLFIEVPVEERLRVVPTETIHSHFQVERVLVLGAPWSHAELVAALLAEAMQWGSLDLRYLGYRPEDEWVAKEAASRAQLESGAAQCVWALAQRSDMMRALHQDILRAASRHLIVAVTYDPGVARFVARQWASKERYIDDALRVVDDLAAAAAERTDVIRVHVADADVVGTDGAVDRHRMTDVIRFATAEVLNLLYDKRMGPAAPLWGDRFKDLREGDERRARVPLLRTTVRWTPDVDRALAG